MDPQTADEGATVARTPVRRSVKLTALALAVLLGLGVLEVTLRAVDRLARRDAFALGALVPDPVLQIRIAPNAAGHDANGFRNQQILAHADVVAIGDSQTWGVSAPRRAAWPQTLARLSGKSVYNMALGGYGPVHYLALLPRALALTPRTVVVGLYLGNDLYDAYLMGYTFPAHAEWRDPQLAAALDRDTIRAPSEALMAEIIPFENHAAHRGPVSWTWWPRAHSAIGRAFDSLFGLTPAMALLDGEWARAQPDHGTVFSHGAISTVLTPAYRLLALDLDEPRIAEGLRITRGALARMRSTTAAAGVNLVVLLIPTKESVYAELLAASGAPPSSTMKRLVEMEARVHADLVEHCRRLDLPLVDALPALRSAAAADQPIYQHDTDGHPGPQGYRVLATLVHDELSRRRWLGSP